MGARDTLGCAVLTLGLFHQAKRRYAQARDCLTKAILMFEACEADTYWQQAREALASLL